MRIYSIDLPRRQGAVAFDGGDFTCESDSNFQSANDNQSEQIGVESQRVDASPKGAEGSSGLLYSSGSVKTPKPGRPRSAPWDKHRENGRLRYGRKAITKFIADDVVTAILDGAQHANLIKAPLNTFITIRPANIDSIEPEARSAFWQDELNRVQAFARHHGVEPTYIWSRESRPEDKAGEHLHLLMHLPTKLRDTLRQRLGQRYPDHAEVDVRPASEITRRAENGKIVSAVTYLVKALSPQARRRSSQPYRKSGPVVGKRAGMTRNISAKAVAAYRSSSSQFTRRVA